MSARPMMMARRTHNTLRARLVPSSMRCRHSRGATISLEIMVESATLATTTMAVAADKPPRNTRMVSQGKP